MGTDDPQLSPAAGTVPASHPIGFWFFFWGELAERCSYYGMRAILALYMTEKLGVDKADAGTFMSLFIAACYFFPLIGGWLADNYFGKYWTIVGFSVPYVVAQFMVGIENRYVVFGALLLLAMGSGVIKPNISTLMGLTYDQKRPGQDQLRTSAFSWFYMAINFGAALSQFVMPWLRTNYGYGVAFLFPAGLMSLALFIFALGKRFYAQEVIERKVRGAPGDPTTEGKTLTGLPIKYRPVSPDELDAERALRKQTLLKIGSLFLMVMFFWAIFDQAASTWIFFADTYMDCTLFGVPTSADAIQGFNPVFIVLLVPVSVALFKALQQAGWKVRATDKMVVGFVLTGLAMVIMSVAGFLAGEKRQMVKLTVPEGALILPMWTDTKLDSVRKDAQGQPITVGTGVRIAAADWEYDADKKKLTFASGTILLAGGKEIPVASGHLPPNLPTPEQWSSGGVMEPLLKSEADRAAVSKEAGRVSLETVDWVPPPERVTVWWQVFAYLILTVAEILISITGLELAFVAAPPSMKSFVTACWLGVVFLANLLINAPITRLYPTMTPGAYFALLAGAMGVVTVMFVFVAQRFNRPDDVPTARMSEGETEAK